MAKCIIKSTAKQKAMKKLLESADLKRENDEKTRDAINSACSSVNDQLTNIKQRNNNERIIFMFDIDK